jgi:hypothetical protein
VWGYPLTPIFYLTAMTWILAVALFTAPGPSLVALFTVLAGIPAYHFTVGRKLAGGAGNPADHS